MMENQTPQTPTVQGIPWAPCPRCHSHRVFVRPDNTGNIVAGLIGAVVAVGAGYLIGGSLLGALGSRVGFAFGFIAGGIIAGITLHNNLGHPPRRCQDCGLGF